MRGVSSPPVRKYKTMSDMTRELYENLSSNEVFQTNSLIVLVKNMLCSEFHRQNVSI